MMVKDGIMNLGDQINQSTNEIHWDPEIKINQFNYPKAGIE
jgi:hypothetical protein